MILRFPSGFYLNQIPLKADDSGSVTWTISTESPLRPTTLLQQYPLGKQLQKLSAKSSNRVKYGELYSTVANSGSSDGLSNSIRYEVGAILTPSDLLDIIPVTNSNINLEIQHINNIYDLETLGLSASEVSQVSDEIVKLDKELRLEFNNTKIELDRSINKSIEVNKQITELDNSIDAITLTTLTSIKDKLQVKLNELKQEQAQLELDIEILVERVDVLYDEIVQVSILLR